MTERLGGPGRKLSLFDSTAIIVGIIVGIGIYETAPLIAHSAGSPRMTIFIWLFGGFLSLLGALCWAELSTMYPEEGGEYVYLREAFGRRIAYLFAWSKLVIVRPGSIAAMAFPFASYLQAIWSPFADTILQPHTATVFASSAVIFFTAVNLFGVRSGSYTQNIFTVVKVLGLCAIIVIGFFSEQWHGSPTEQLLPRNSDLGLALILVLFTYGGWNEIAYTAAEVTNPERNLLRALLLGTLLVTILYVFANWAFLSVLGFEAMTASNAVAVDAVARTFPENSAVFVTALICISALGAINGMTFTGARVSYAMGLDYPEYGLLSRWSSRFDAPVIALLLQGGISLLIIILAGSFTMTVVYTTAVVWIFFLLSAISLFVLRVKKPTQTRPFKTPGHPLTTLVFCASCIYLIWSAFFYNVMGTLIAFAILLLGIPVQQGLRKFLQLESQ